LFSVLHEFVTLEAYLSPNIIRLIESRRMIWAGHVAYKGERRGACSVLVGKPEGKRPLVRLMRTWKNNIKIDLQEMGWGGITRIGLVQDSDRWQVFD
jgi:hypothetical protein